MTMMEQLTLTTSIVEPDRTSAAWARRCAHQHAETRYTQALTDAVLALGPLLQDRSLACVTFADDRLELDGPADRRLDRLRSQVRAASSWQLRGVMLGDHLLVDLEPSEVPRVQVTAAGVHAAQSPLDVDWDLAAQVVALLRSGACSPTADPWTAALGAWTAAASALATARAALARLHGAYELARRRQAEQARWQLAELIADGKVREMGMKLHVGADDDDDGQLRLTCRLFDELWFDGELPEGGLALQVFCALADEASQLWEQAGRPDLTDPSVRVRACGTVELLHRPGR